MPNTLTPDQLLPLDGTAGTLVGRAWVPASLTGSVAGPSPVLVTDDGVFDLSAIAPTLAQLLDAGFDRQQMDLSKARHLGSLTSILANTLACPRNPEQAYLLTPIDLQAIKACGVTFVCSMLERVIEERAGGDAAAADAIRQQLGKTLDTEIADIVPGSADAEKLKAALQAAGLWSQYLEVGIGPYAEVFTKSQPLSAVGAGDQVGVLPFSSWNNPEPEVVLIVNSKAEVVGATLGNDVNLRDIEGRSALLLGKAKDNNASCAIGPLIRLFDNSFTMDHVRNAEVSLTVTGADGFTMNEKSLMTKISRDPLDLVRQTMGENHQYPDGIALFTGTLFAPTQDRDQKGLGFTHKLDDEVRVSSPMLGTLVNTVTHTNKAPAWQFGISALMKNLASRGLLG